VGTRETAIAGKPGSCRFCVNYTEGWDRQVLLNHEKGKARKRMINIQWIYPPAANRLDALAAGNPNVSNG
jgi:NADH dehydrogenase